MMRRFGVALVFALALSAPVAALAEDYPGPKAQVLGETVEQPAVAPAAAVKTAPVSTLPVTGGDIAEMAFIGLGLVGVGTVLVRRSRRPAQTA